MKKIILFDRKKFHRCRICQLFTRKNIIWDLTAKGIGKVYFCSMEHLEKYEKRKWFVVESSLAKIGAIVGDDKYLREFQSHRKCS